MHYLKVVITTFIYNYNYIYMYIKLLGKYLNYLSKHTPSQAT